MNSVRAKFICQEVNHATYGTNVKMNAVCSDKGENKDFTDATPSGSHEMFIQKGYPAEKFFEAGKSYYLDFTEAPE